MIIKYQLLAILLVVVPGTPELAVARDAFGVSGDAAGLRGPYEWAFVRLDYARKEKVKQLQHFCRRVQDMAGKAASDKFVKACFNINLQYSEAVRKGDAPASLDAKVKELREGFDRYYVQEYFTFYDMLFVNMKGDIFYTIRKQSDRSPNLLDNPEDMRPLAHCLQKKPDTAVFVDFHLFGPASEPVAFFVAPMHDHDKQTGWLVLQCAANKLDSLFAWTEHLGQTGETFLVNQEGFMLTESNFEGDSTILRKKLDDRNIQAKFADRQGHRVVLDYRGCTAFSSFEVVPFLGTRWLVVAKMDKAEVVTKHFNDHREYYGDILLSSLKRSQLKPLRDISLPSHRNALRTDMDEFMKADQSEHLETFGISTCTGLLAAYPGKFAYLAHISAKDRLYGGEETNLLGQMIKKLTVFDIYPCEKRQMMFVIVAPHLESTLAIVDKLLSEDFLLSQIWVMYNPDALSATMDYDYKQDELMVLWRSHDYQQRRGIHLRNDALNAGQIIEAVMKCEQGSLAVLKQQTNNNQGG